MKNLLAVFLAVFMITCAHKAPPLFKDRMKPKLQNISALNNRQIQFTFSEDIDTLVLSPENISIFAGDDTLAIQTLYPSLSAAEIVAITEPQTNIEYSASGFVFDTAQNKGDFTKKFMGTSIPDTIAPWIIKYASGKDQSKFYFHFSEAMDTTFFEFSMIPKKNLTLQWRNLRVCDLFPGDTLNEFAYDTTYYIYIDKGCRDLSGNLFNTLVTSITPDTAFKPYLLKGAAHINDTLVKTGIAFLKREVYLGVALIENGDFQFETRDSLPYTIEIISGKYSGSSTGSSTDTLNIIELEQKEKDLDNIFN
jgi:hypothetical protein